MSNRAPLLIAIVFQLLCSPLLFALDRNVPDFQDKWQIAKLEAKLRQSFQEQKPELLQSLFVYDLIKYSRSVKDVSPDNPNETSNMSPAMLDLNNSFNQMFLIYQDRKIYKPNESLSNTWDFDVIHDSLSFSENKKEAWLRLLIGSDLLPEDSTYLLRMSAQETSVLSERQKKKILKYWPLNLHLVKEYSLWKISDIGELKNFAVKRREMQMRNNSR